MTNTKSIKSSPRDVFMYLLGTAALYFSVSAVLNILFGVIDSRFPDPLNQYYKPSEGVRWWLALVVVIFPVYLWVSRANFKDIVSSPTKASIKIRRWLLYLTIFLAAILLIGDLVALIFRFLEGDLSAPFALKVVFTFAVGAAVFWYYLYDLRRKPAEFSDKAKIFAWTTSLFVLAVVVAGFFVAGSPFRQRLVRFDSQKVSHLQEIQWRIVNYWQQKDRLPAALADLRDDISGFVPPVDPETGAPYEFRQAGELSFELCANFNLPSEEKNGAAPYVVRPVEFGVGTESWSHAQGRHCFPRTIDPELYKLDANRMPTKL